MKKKKTQLIRTLPELNAALAKGYNEFAISLSGGLCFSRKEIKRLGSRVYRVYNSIDETTINLPASQLFDSRRTNIGHAMEKGAFVVML